MSEAPPPACAHLTPNGIFREAAVSGLLERDKRMLASCKCRDCGFA
jgi:hypothetical protein